MTVVTALLSVVALTGTACTGDEAEPDPDTSQAGSSSATAVEQSGAGSADATSSDTTGADASVAFPADTEDDVEASTGQVLFTAIRVGRQDGFDRVVWEFSGDGQPGWRAGYTDTPSREGSGDPVTLPGEATLAVTIEGVALPVDSEVPGIPYEGPAVVSAGDTELVTEVLVGAWFEGYQDSFVGVSAQAPFRVYRLADPTRIVLEVRQG